MLRGYHGVLRRDLCGIIFAAMEFRPPTVSVLLRSLGWALAACLLIALGILHAKSDAVKRDLARSGERVGSLSRDLAAERRWSTILSSTAMRTASFTLTPDADPDLRARAVMDPVTRRAVLVFDNFKAADGHAYEVWAFHGSTPASLGRVHADASGRAVMRVEDVGDPNDLTAFAISLEAEGAPAPGAAPPAGEPAGPIVMIGSLGG
jgi:hypothetical protein